MKLSLVIAATLSMIAILSTAQVFADDTPTKFLGSIDLSQCSPNKYYTREDAKCAGPHKGHYKVEAELSTDLEASPTAAAENISYRGGDIDTEVSSTLQCEFRYTFTGGEIALKITDRASGQVVANTTLPIVAEVKVEGETLPYVGHTPADCKPSTQTRRVKVTYIPTKLAPIQIQLAGEADSVNLHFEVDSYRGPDLPMAALTADGQTAVFEGVNADAKSLSLSWIAAKTYGDRNNNGQYVSVDHRTQGTAVLKTLAPR